MTSGASPLPESPGDSVLQPHVGARELNFCRLAAMGAFLALRCTGSPVLLVRTVRVPTWALAERRPSTGCSRGCRCVDNSGPRGRLLPGYQGPSPA